MRTPSTAPETLASLLIVYVNSSVGVEMARRLFDAAEVSIAPAVEAINGLARGWNHDVVILCPYLAESERAALLAALDGQALMPAVLEVHDRVAPPGAHVRVRSNDRGLVLEPILEALALPLEGER